MLERPSIESFEITGNKEIKTEDLQKSLRNVGPRHRQNFRPLGAGGRLAVSERSILQPRQVRGPHQHRSQEVTGNRVKLKIEIHEGKRARIRQINVIGNQAFSNSELQRQFELQDAELGLLVQAGRPVFT